MANKNDLTVLLARTTVRMQDAETTVASIAHLEKTWREHGQELKAGENVFEKIAGNWYIDRANELAELLKGVPHA